MKRGLSPHCDWSACLHQHFFCTCIFNPTRPFFIQVAEASSGYCSALSHGYLHHFLHQICLAPWGTLPLHNDIPITTSQILVTADLADCHKQDLGPLALSVIVSHSWEEETPPYRSAWACANGTANESHTCGVHELVGCTKTLKHFRAGSVHIQFWCLGTGTHVMPKGQKAPFLLKGRGILILMPSKGQPYALFILLYSLFLLALCWVCLQRCILFNQILKMKT